MCCALVIPDREHNSTLDDHQENEGSKDLIADHPDKKKIGIGTDIPEKSSIPVRDIEKDKDQSDDIGQSDKIYSKKKYLFPGREKEEGGLLEIHFLLCETCSITISLLFFLNGCTVIDTSTYSFYWIHIFFLSQTKWL
jgi:hypothetical protein